MPLTDRLRSKEVNGVNDVGHGDVAAGRRPRLDAFDRLRLARPERAVADDAGVERVDADRCELDGQRMHEAADAAVDGRHSGRARVRTLLGEPTEQHDRGVGCHAGEQCVDDLGVADELHRDEVGRPSEVIVLGGVGVAVDRGEHECVDGADVGKCSGDAVRGSRARRPDPRASPPISFATSSA